MNIGTITADLKRLFEDLEPGQEERGKLIPEVQAFGQVVRAARKATGKTIQAMADSIGMAKSQLLRVELGIVAPLATTVARLEKGLGVSLQEPYSKIPARKKVCGHVVGVPCRCGMHKQIDSDMRYAQRQRSPYQVSTKGKSLKQLAQELDRKELEYNWNKVT